MTAVTTLPFGRPLTRADLEDLPDDGHRYELIDGVLLVSPGPQLPHQDMVGNLYLLLRAGCPAHLKVVLAPFAVALSDDTEVQPDLLVAQRTQFTRKDLSGPPLLAVEVLSPSTRRFDLLLKRDRLQPPVSPRTGWSTPTGPRSPSWSCAAARTSRWPGRGGAALRGAAALPGADGAPGPARRLRPSVSPCRSGRAPAGTAR